jgi:hypothetical protein
MRPSSHIDFPFRPRRKRLWPHRTPSIARPCPPSSRAGCERSNSFKKVTSRFGERPCRSAVQFLVRLALVSLLEHARAWLAEDRQREEGAAA